MDLKYFHNRLRQARLKKGLTLKEVAKACNIKKNTLSQLELGKYSLTLQNLEELKLVFDMNEICLDGYEYLLLNYDRFIYRLNAFSNENVPYIKYRKIADTLEVSIETIKNWITRKNIIKYKTYNRIKDKLEKNNLIP